MCVQFIAKVHLIDSQGDCQGVFDCQGVSSRLFTICLQLLSNFSDVMASTASSLRLTSSFCEMSLCRAISCHIYVGHDLRGNEGVRNRYKGTCQLCH